MNTKKYSTPASTEAVSMALITAGSDVTDLQYRIHCATELVRQKCAPRRGSGPQIYRYCVDFC